jgi:hypothetical protein
MSNATKDIVPTTAEQIAKMTGIQALKAFFNEPVLTTAELRSLSKDERDHLASLARAAMTAAL